MDTRTVIRQVMKEARLSSFQYTPPSDPRELMYDFYLVTFLAPYVKDESVDVGIRYAIRDTRRVISDHLRDMLLGILFDAVSGELRHLWDYKGEETDEVIETEATLSEIQTAMLEHFKEDLKFYKWSETNWETQTSPKEAANYAQDIVWSFDSQFFKNSEGSPGSIAWVQMTGELFGIEKLWAIDYGGKPWQSISNAWLKLYENGDVNDPKQLNNLQVWIDHVFDLQHNTGTILNKTPLFHRGPPPENRTAFEKGYQWIQTALDHKAQIEDPYELFRFASASMRKLAAAGIYDATGQTYQEWKKTAGQKIRQRMKATGSVVVQRDELERHREAAEDMLEILRDEIGADPEQVKLFVYHLPNLNKILYKMMSPGEGRLAEIVFNEDDIWIQLYHNKVPGWLGVTVSPDPEGKIGFIPGLTGLHAIDRTPFEEGEEIIPLLNDADIRNVADYIKALHQNPDIMYKFPTTAEHEELVNYEKERRDALKEPAAVGESTMSKKVIRSLLSESAGTSAAQLVERFKENRYDKGLVGRIAGAVWHETEQALRAQNLTEELKQWLYLVQQGRIVEAIEQATTDQHKAWGEAMQKANLNGLAAMLGA